MKKRLDELLSQTIDLLAECGWPDQADWYRHMREDLNASHPGSPEFKVLIGKLNKTLAGMGSFSDIPLQSPTGKLSEQELGTLQWELVVQLGDAIASYL